MGEAQIYTVSGRIIAVLLGLVVVAVAGEVAVRVVLKDEVVIFPRYHTSAVYGDFTIRRFRPNTVFWHTSVDGSWRFQTDAQGFRDTRDFPHEKPPGVVRIITLGDSQMAGFETRQDQTFSAVLERYLGAHGVSAQVINTGVSGFGTAEELVLLENEAMRYAPDVVVLAFYANDFQDNVKAGLFALENGELVLKKHIHTPGVAILDVINDSAVLRWLSENSYLYSVGLNVAWLAGKRLLLSHSQAELQTEFALSTEEQVGDYEMQLVRRLIQRMYAFCQAHGVRLIILDIPRPAPLGEVSSSVPVAVEDTMRQFSDAYLDSREVFEEYRGLVELHRPHGHRHISEFTHLTLAVQAGRIVTRWVEEGQRQ